MELGFVGFGVLAQAIIKRLRSKGIKITLWNRTLEKLKNSGLPYVKSIKELFTSKDVLILCVSDSDAVREILWSVEGELKNKIIVDLTTNHYPSVVEFHEILRKNQGYYLETPVLGSVIPAEKGELGILVSGERYAFERVKSLLEVLAKKVIYFETPGKATQAKLINNYVSALIMVALASGIALGEVSGFKKEEIIEVLSLSSANSFLLQTKKENIIKEYFKPHFSVNNMLKDLSYAGELFDTVGGIYFEGAEVKEVFKLAKRLGYGDMDFSAVYKALKRINTPKEVHDENKSRA